jgi:serine/threonine protein phosphatase PrpC
MAQLYADRVRGGCRLPSNFMAIEAFGATDRGCVRTENEDRIFVDDPLGLYLVCDGMGGGKHGEIAAEMAVGVVRSYIHSSQDRYDASWPLGYAFDLSLDANRVATGVKLANLQIWRTAEQRLECAGMGTTIAAVLIGEGRAVVGNVGDTRVYLCRENRLAQMTFDDTMVASMMRSGLLSADEAASHPMRNVITQAAGSRANVEVHLHEESIAPGDILLICSDGLYNLVKEPDIVTTLAESASPEAAAKRLIDAAVNWGAPDNVSAVVLRYS